MQPVYKSEGSYADVHIRAYADPSLYDGYPIPLSAGQGVIAGGTVMAKQTSSSEYVPYDDDGTDDGRRTATCILESTVDTNNGADPVMGYGYDKGPFIEANLIGLDAAAKTDLRAVSRPGGILSVGLGAVGPTGPTGPTGPIGPTGPTGA